MGGRRCERGTEERRGEGTEERRGEERGGEVEEEGEWRSIGSGRRGGGCWLILQPIRNSG